MADEAVIAKEKKEPLCRPLFDTPIQYPPEAIPEKEEALRAAMDTAPHQVRDVYVDAPQRHLAFFLEHPELSFKIIREVLNKTPFRLEKDEETGEWILRRPGAKYTLIPLTEKKVAGLAGFGALYDSPLPMLRSKVFGHGILMISACQGDDKDETVLDLDLMILADKKYGNLRDAASSYMVSEAGEDAESIIDSLAYLVDEIMFDAETLAEDIEAEDEIFSKEEMELFRKWFVGN